MIWDRLCAFVAANTGLDFETILDTMTFSRLDALQAEWRLRPPAHWLIANFLGYEPPPENAADRHMTAEAAADWFARTGGRIDGVRQR